MPMNLVIQEKHRELGLTQEQVAEYQNALTPAVSKWEAGITSPDISILPPLARFLKIDLNTLFYFSEDITAKKRQYLQGYCKGYTERGFCCGFQYCESQTE